MDQQGRILDAILGRRLRWRRLDLDATQKEVGLRAGISYQQVQRFEGGLTRISAAMLWRLANALDVSVAYLFQDFERERPLFSDTELFERRSGAPPRSAPPQAKVETSPLPPRP